jgi:DtxR family Mn-dependent transcriptional regulator
MMAGSESREEYLEAIFKLGGTEAGATVTRVAQDLSVSPASASEMIGRLTRDGCLVRDEEGRLALSEVGRAEAVRLVRRHRLSERFLTDCLDLPWDQVHEEACRFEHVLSDAVEARLAERLGHPSTCPHGRAIPDESGMLAEETSRCLADLGPGDRCTIAHVSEESPELLRYIASLGLLPGATLVVEEVAPFEGPLMILVGERRHPLGREVALKLFVR